MNIKTQQQEYKLNQKISKKINSKSITPAVVLLFFCKPHKIATFLGTSEKTEMWNFLKVY